MADVPRDHNVRGLNAPGENDMHTGAKLTVSALLIGILSACGGGGGGSPPNSPPPPAPATVKMSLSQPSARVGDSVTLTWSAADATSCTASGAWTGSKPTSGSTAASTTQTGAINYTLTCSGAGGSGQDSVRLNVAGVATNLSIPGLPAPVPVASGACVPSSDANFQYTCISTEAAIPSQFDTFQSTISGQVTVTGNNPPTVQTAGSCSGGFNLSTGTFTVNTPLGNDYISFANANISEVVFSNAFLASVGVQNTFTSMSALVIGDATNPDHYQVIVVATGAQGTVTVATGGTMSTSNGTTSLDILECLGVPSTPAPPPPPASLSCTPGAGGGTNGLSFATAQELPQMTWQLSTGAANQSGTANFVWGVSFDNPNVSASSYTGSLQFSLWAVPYDFQGSGAINGYKIASAAPMFSGAGAKSANQIYNLYWFAPITSNGVPATNPPAGSYCMVMALEQYDSNPNTCSAADHFCYVDWSQGSTPQAFQ